MSTLASLRARVDRMIEHIDQAHAPKMWLLLQEQGLGVPDALQQLLGPHDSLLIEEMPTGFLGDMYQGPVFYPIPG